jgi:hypothetical protein
MGPLPRQEEIGPQLYEVDISSLRGQSVQVFLQRFSRQGEADAFVFASGHSKTPSASFAAAGQCK